MKTTVIFLICIAITTLANGQVNMHESSEEMRISQPRFNGTAPSKVFHNKTAIESIQEYITGNFQFPDYSGILPVVGTEVVRFVVTDKGELTSFRVVNSLSPEIDAEIIRILQTTNGMWAPGTENGKPVDMVKEISCVLKVSESEEYALEEDFLVLARKCFEKASKKFVSEGKPKKALKFYNEGIQYLPNDNSLLYMRGLCKYALGDMDGARNDWVRLHALNGTDVMVYYFNDSIRNLDGYEESLSILNEKNE